MDEIQKSDKEQLFDVIQLLEREESPPSDAIKNKLREENVRVAMPFAVPFVPGIVDTGYDGTAFLDFCKLKEQIFSEQSQATPTSSTAMPFSWGRGEQGRRLQGELTEKQRDPSLSQASDDADEAAEQER
eukprot:748196-Hanusia_phi.AAC.5